LPLLLVPLILSLSRTKRSTNTSFVDEVLNSYWFKANLYIFIFGFFGNYIGSEYFFDVLGMIYNYPNATTTLDATLVGHSNQPVPVIMYFYTHAYFMTYHTTAIILLRRIMSSGVPLAGLLFMPFTFAIGYCWAWVETKAMANPLMATSFYYENMDAMLAYGSIIYATYFIGSFPIFYFIDEKSTARWNITKVIAAGLSASMIVFYLLELCARYIGSI
jgi:cycloeucalenol cycloisomerase